MTEKSKPVSGIFRFIPFLKNRTRCIYLRSEIIRGISSLYILLSHHNTVLMLTKVIEFTMSRKVNNKSLLFESKFLILVRKGIFIANSFPNMVKI